MPRMKTRNCKQCSGPVTSRHLTAKFCSRACQAKSYVIPRTPCPACGKRVLRARQIHCSAACQATTARVPKTLFPRPCEHCGKIFKPTKDGARRFCNRLCAARGSGLAKRKERLTTIHGYSMLYRPGHPMATKAGYVMEHRLLMAESLGRQLAASEVVHHINGNRGDNSLQNLMVMTKEAHDQTPKQRRKTVIACPHCAGRIKLSNAVRSVAPVSKR